MHFEDFDVELRPERARHALDEGGEQVDPEAHVAGLHDTRAVRGGGDRLLVVGRKSGGADDVDEATLRDLSRRAPPSLQAR